MRFKYYKISHMPLHKHHIWWWGVSKKFSNIAKQWKHVAQATVIISVQYYLLFSICWFPLVTLLPFEMFLQSQLLIHGACLLHHQLICWFQVVILLTSLIFSSIPIIKLMVFYFIHFEKPVMKTKWGCTYGFLKWGQGWQWGRWGGIQSLHT